MAAEKNNKTLNVPNLRFPEFSEEWEKVPLSQIATRVTRKNKNNATRLPLTISAQHGLVDQVTFFNKVVASSDMSNYYLLHRGEFAYNKSYSGDYPWGAIKRLDRYDQGALSSLYICFAPTDIIDSDFLVHYFESPKWHREVSNIAGEGARNHGLLNIAVPDFFNTQHSITTNKKEQRKIADFLNLIDERIETQRRIIEDLKKLKRAICKSVFTSPECVTRKMDDIATVTMGQSPSSRSYNDNQQGLPLIQGHLDLYDGRIRPRIYTSEITQTCKKGDVILTVRAPVGEIAHAQLTACIGRGVCTISPHTSSDAELIYQFLNYYKPTWTKLEQGSTFSSINGADIRGIAVRCPSMSKIKLLQLLDARLQASVCLLNAYSVSKDCLLSQLFI